MSRLTLLLTGAALLSGCSMAPRYVRPAMPVPATLPAVPAAGEASLPADLAWRDFFTDERLRQLIATALDNNRDLRIAVANVAQARARYRVQRADILPTIGVGGSATYQKTPSGLGGLAGGGIGGAGGGTGGGVATNSTRVDVYQAGVGVSAWEADLFGRIASLTKAAQEEYFASQATRDAARTALIAETATAWLTLASDQDRLRIARDTVRAFGDTLEIVRGRAREGVASDLEVRQAQTGFDQARSDVATALTVVARDRNAIDLLAGGPVPDAMLPDSIGATDATIPDLPAGLPSDILLRRPDVQAAEHQLRAANANIGAARAAFFPRVSLTAAFGTLSLGLSNLFGQGSSFWSAAPSATLPIFDAGRNIGNLRYAEATRDGMVASYEKVVQTAFRETADALARRATIKDQTAAQQSLEEAAAGAYRIAERRYAEGIDPFLVTLDAQRSWYAARQSLVATRLDRQANAVELYRALGGGLK